MSNNNKITPQRRDTIFRRIDEGLTAGRVAVQLITEHENGSPKEKLPNELIKELQAFVERQNVPAHSPSHADKIELKNIVDRFCSASIVC